MICVRGVKIGERVKNGGTRVNPAVCGVIRGRNDIEILRELCEAERVKPDILEWRADFYGVFDNAGARNSVFGTIRKKFPETPLIFTPRGLRGDEARQKILTEAISCKLADIADAEFESGQEFIKKAAAAAKAAGVYLIVSCHDYFTTPARDKMVSILNAMLETGADAVKLAVTANGPGDSEELYAATREFCAISPVPAIAVSMGESGAASRADGHLYGSAVTYGSLMEKSAPGQLSAAELRERGL